MLRFFGMLVGAGVLALAAYASAALPDAHEEHGPAPIKEAVAVFTPTSGSKVSGSIVLVQQGVNISLKGEIQGLKAGEHGFHIHSYGDLRKADGTSAGGHYAPDGHSHGGPKSAEHHAGDLGNIKANEDGVAKIDITVPDLNLHFIIGRSLVVHGDPDDLKSQPAGNSGPRVGVAVIGVANTEPPKK